MEESISPDLHPDNPQLFLEVNGQVAVDPQVTSGPNRMRAEAELHRLSNGGGAIVELSGLPTGEEDDLSAARQRRDAASRVRGKGVI